MENTTNPEIIDNGNINISNDVVAIIASIAATGIDGVVGMAGSISGGFAEFLGKKNLSKGVKVNIEENTVELDLAIVVEYGAKIPDVAWEIQDKVKSEVEAMTGLDVTAVNVSVEGVSFVKKAEDTPEEKTDDEIIVEDETMEDGE